MNEMTQEEKDKKLIRAVRSNGQKAVKDMLELGASPDACSENKRLSAIALAYRYGFIKIADILFEAGADINYSNYYETFALMEAVSHGYTDAVRTLIKRGADIHLTDIGGETALHRAVRRSYTEIMQILLEAGADVNAKEGSGYTPLMYAAMSGNIDGMIMLVRAGADTSIRNIYGQSAQDKLKAIHPDGYNGWICKLKKEMLEHEDIADTAGIYHEPDFYI